MPDRTLPRRPALALTAMALFSLLTLTDCGGQDVTRPALETDIATVYANREQAREQLLGGNAQAGPPEVAARCYRGGPDQPDVGPGKDWRCDLTVHGSTGAPTVSYLVNARTNACWTALPETLSATAEAVDVATMTDPSTGATVADPTGGFDGCLQA